MTLSEWSIEVGEALDVLRRLPNESVDGIVTDPPYSSGGAFRSDRMASTNTKYVQSGQRLARADFHGDNRDQRSFFYWSALWLSECLRIARVGAPICVFTDWRQLPTTTDAIQAGGWVWRGIVPWNKTEGARPQMGRFRTQCEYVVWGSKGPMPMRVDVGTLPGFFEKFLQPEDRHHIACKPISVMQEIVRVVPPGGIVLDPFSGSSSTGVAALREGRRYIGIELGEDLAAVGRRRLEQEDGATAAGDGEQLSLDTTQEAEPA